MSTAESQHSYPTSIRAVPTEIDTNFPPENKETAPFSVLSSLFDRLQGERKPEKRHRLLNSWFNVCLRSGPCYVLELIDLVALAKRKRLQSIPRPTAHLAICESVVHPYVFHSLKSPSERQRALRVRSQGEEPSQSLHQTYPTGIEGPRCHPLASVETTYREMGEKTNS